MHTTSRFRLGCHANAAFTLIELVLVIGVIILLMALLAPAFTNLKSAGDVTGAADTIKGVLERGGELCNGKQHLCMGRSL